MARNILVTGGGTGIGLAVARHFAALGDAVTITGRRAEPLAVAAEETGARALVCDHTDPEALTRLVAELPERIDVLVNNAGGNTDFDHGAADDLAGFARAFRANLDANLVGAALTRGPQFAALLGFVAGVALDLAPPADHVAGRWALALVVVGYLAGRMRQSTRPTATAVVATVAASSFVGSSIFAISGLVLRDPPLAVPDLLQVILVAVGWDILLTPFVLPLVMGMFVRLEPSRTT